MPRPPENKNQGREGKGIAGRAGYSTADRGPWPESTELELALLAGIVEASPDSIIGTDLDGRIISWNPGAERMYGYSAEEVQGRNIAILMPPDRLDELAIILAAIADGTGVTYFDSARVRKDGATVDVSVAIAPIKDPSGHVMGAAKIDRDITDRKRSETERALLAAIVQASPDSIASTDVAGTITSWNPGAERMYGYTEEEIVGRSISTIIPDDRKDELQMILAAIAEGKGVTYFDSTRLHKSGRPVEVSVAITPIRDRAGRLRGAAKIDRDITERKELEHQLQHDAFHDRLTGVANRSLFMDRLEHVVTRAQGFGERYALFVMDMDNFKLINDTYGHQIGDELLSAFVARISELLRPVDTLARFGGDEFTVVLEEAGDSQTAVQIAGRILAALQAPFQVQNQSLTVSSSIGIMFGDDPNLSADQALRNADVALYEAKRQGKNQFVLFDERMRGAETSRLYLESELRRALESVDFAVEYQPIVDLQTGKPVGCEALARWHHDVMGWVEPKDFISVAEDTGLITPLGRFVLDKACETLAASLAQPGFPADFYVSVNISPKEFFSLDLVPCIEETLQRHGLNGSHVRLEITENVIIQHDQEAANILGQLQALGLAISLDDFGTGYSSLSYLHQLPFDVIKVDRSFIQRLPDTPQSREIVRSVLGLANALGVETVAEGAETEEQLEAVRALGFRWVQGFVLYKPMNRDALAALFR